MAELNLRQIGDKLNTEFVGDTRKIGIDDERYMDEWWPLLCLLKAYFHRLNRTAFGRA